MLATSVRFAPVCGTCRVCSSDRSQQAQATLRCRPVQAAEPQIVDLRTQARSATRCGWEVRSQRQDLRQDTTPVRRFAFEGTAERSFACNVLQGHSNTAPNPRSEADQEVHKVLKMQKPKKRKDARGFSAASSLPELVSRVGLAKAFSVDVTTISRLQREGVLKHNDEGLYNFAGSLRAYMAYRENIVAQKHGSPSSGDALRLAKEAEIARRMAREDREIIALSEALEVYDDITGAFGSHREEQGTVRAVRTSRGHSPERS